MTIEHWNIIVDLSGLVKTASQCLDAYKTTLTVEAHVVKAEFIDMDEFQLSSRSDIRKRVFNFG